MVDREHVPRTEASAEEVDDEGQQGPPRHRAAEEPGDDEQRTHEAPEGVVGHVAARNLEHREEGQDIGDDHDEIGDRKSENRSEILPQRGFSGTVAADLRHGILREDENADKDVKRNVHERRERVVQNQRGEQNVGTADENLRQRHFERGNVKFDVFDDYGLFVKQRRAEINQQAECGVDRYGQSGQVRNRTFADCEIRRQKIAENNQKDTGDQLGKTGKSDHADDIGSVETPARVEPVTDCAAGNDGMAGVVADGKADKSGKNPFPGRQFAADVFQSQKVIRGQGDITAERGHAG